MTVAPAETPGPQSIGRSQYLFLLAQLLLEKMMKLGVYTAILHDRDLPEALDALVELG
ncbi:hypothetical protein [Cryobacterium glaciale]|uniref:hypothetical protein n=1 Tax=Cryobacterium glaciale TaxID=1259145 RepID=UPI0030B9ED14